MGRLARRRVLQRFFSTFPRGLPGLGLLLLRLALAPALAASGAAALGGGGDGSAASKVLGLLAVVSSGALFVGVFTPVAGILAALVTLGLAAGRVALGDVLVLAVPVALVLLGPGAFSLDARLFGWREIVVPRARALPIPSSNGPRSTGSLPSTREKENR